MRDKDGRSASPKPSNFKVSKYPINILVFGILVVAGFSFTGSLRVLR